MARRKTARPPKIKEGTVPAALLIGPCIEVWAENPSTDSSGRVVADITSARRRFRAACEAWWSANHIPETEKFKIIPAGAAWSAHIGEDHARLAIARLTIEDLPALRVQALELLAEIPEIDGPERY